MLWLNFLKYFSLMNRKTDRQTDRQTSTQTRFALAVRTHKHWFCWVSSPDPQRVWGSGNETVVLLCVCVCVCTVFSVLKLFTVELAIFTAGSKPTSKAKLFTHISRWWGLIEWEQHFRHWGGSLNTNVEEIFGRAACEAIEPYVLITHTHTPLAFVCWVFLLSTCELNATMQITFSSVHLL